MPLVFSVPWFLLVPCTIHEHKRINSHKKTGFPGKIRDIFIDALYHSTKYRNHCENIIVNTCNTVHKQRCNVFLLKSTIFSFQCSFEHVRKGDELLHVFTHYLRRTEDYLHEMMQDYMISHIDWTITIAKTVLNRNGISVEDYIDTVTTPGMAIDPVCVLVLARMFHFHAAIFLKKGVWSTCKDKSLKKCRMGLIFHGGSNFSETVKIGESDSYKSFLDNYTKQGVLLSHLCSKTPGGAIQVKPVPATQPTDCESSDDVANDMGHSYWTR